jgi:transcription-repair coupling factor (superfamily II helicase)
MLKKSIGIFSFLEGKKEILERLEKEKKIEISGLADFTFAFQLAGLVDFGDKGDVVKKQPVFVLVKNEEKAEKLYRHVKFWNFLKFDAKALNFRSFIKILYHLLHRRPKLYIFSFESLLVPLPSPQQFENLILDLSLKQKTKNKDNIIKKLLSLSYEEEKKTFIAGTFSRRGGILDIFSPQNDFPYRLELCGEQIEQIYFFDPKTNKKIKSLATAEIIPTKLLLGKNNLLDYFALFNKQSNNLLPLIIYEDFREIINFTACQKFQKVIENFYQIKISSFKTPQTHFTFSYKSPPYYQRNFSNFQKEIKSFQKQGWRIFILSQHNEKLKKLFPNKNNLNFILTPPNGAISGFQNTKTKLLFLTDFEIFKKEEFRGRKKIDTAFIANLKPGDYIVHLDHGIGKFAGMTKRIVEEIRREFFILEYADGDKLFLPCDRADKITKYIGKAHPQIYRLHGASWNNLKEKIKKDTERLARDLLNLYAKREISSGFVFYPDTLAQKELEDSFEYQETEDQIITMGEIKKDMEGKQAKNSPLLDFEKSLAKKPMDRLVCGDVGFGKTELALRAAFKAVQDKKQVALLCPTTILAQQHFNTFSSRLKNFQTKLAVLSRFQTKKQQKEIIAKLACGEINIIIGTHRLLSSDVKFYDLGLLILDEEQRFGVKQKEKIKKMRENVDILTLSATPIPRTLHLVLSGLRDISTLTTPLPGRLPIETFIIPYDDKIICQAIKQEINRRGQIYFLHNRVQTINLVTQKLKKLLPRVKFAIAHGKIPESKLAKIMSDFYHKKFDVLVCSSIIENGLDLPNVNTLIVDNATRFGLADLYQLRGRVGRGSKKAYAHFFYHSQNLKTPAKMRLEALLEAKELGSGFQIAQRDLEIRGAGNILGEKQSGNIKAIGLSLYCRLLAQAVEEIKTGKKQEDSDVTIDLPLAAYIPKNFIASENERLSLYQKIANIYGLEELQKFKEKTIYNFYHGRDKISIAIPQEFLNLFEILEIKILARQAKITKIDTQIITPLTNKKFHRLILKLKNKIKPQTAAKLLQKNQNFQISDFEIKIRLDNLRKNWLLNLKNYLKILAG